MSMKPVTTRFIDTLLADVCPGAAEMVDFGLNNCPDQWHLYGVYQQGIKGERFTAQELDAALGNGPKLTSLVRRIDPKLTVETDYDRMGEPM